MVSIKIDDVAIPTSNKAKNLGLIVDNSFRYKDQIQKYVIQAYINLKKLYPHRHALNQKTKTMLCEALVLSHFPYCSPVYHACLDAASSDKVQKVQNACLRFIFGIRKFQHISHKLTESGWLNMKNRRILASVCLYHSIIITKQPAYLYNKITFRTDVHNINIRFKGLLTPPAHKTALFERSFQYNIQKYYNALPSGWKGVGVTLFRRNVSQMLFDKQCGGDSWPT